jgi:hypothetical protein
MQMTQIAAYVFAAMIVALAVFQIALAAGAPLGRFAWGGAHERLPAGFRLGSLASILIYGACAGIILDRAGLAEVVGDDVSRIGAWVIAGFFTLGRCDECDLALEAGTFHDDACGACAGGERVCCGDGVKGAVAR